MKMIKAKTVFRALILIAVLIAALCLGTTASAEENNIVTTAKIVNSNVSFDGKLRLAFTVESTLLTPDDATLGIMVWSPEVTEPTLKNCKYVNLNAKTQNGVTYYLVRPNELSDIATEFYVAACYKQNGEFTIAETPFKYSIENHFTAALASEITEECAYIYSEYLDLARDAGATDFTGIRTHGGYVGYNKFTFGGALNQNVLLRADAKNADGDYFLAWKDSYGKVISRDRVTTVTVEEKGVTEYTAMYGDRELSKYRSTFDFEAMDTGLVDISYPVEDNTAKIVLGYDSAKTPLFSGSKSFDGLSISTYRSLKKVGQDQYVYSTGHDFSIVDAPIGGKSMHITNGHQARGMSATFSDIYESYAIGAEVDMQYNTAKSGGFFHINLTIVDKNGKSCALRTNITSNGSTLTFYAEGDGSAYPSVYIEKKPELKRGNVLSFRAELDRDSEAVKIYANGELLQSLSLTSYATYKKIVEKAETDETATLFDLQSLTISKIAVCGISSTKDNITVDNVTFLCGEPIVNEENGEEGNK